MKLVQLLILISLLAGCFEKPDTKLFRKGVRAQADRDYPEAMGFFKKALIETSDKNLKLVATKKIIELLRLQKNYESLSQHLNFLVLNSEDPKQRMKAKQSLADNHFFKLKNYAQAIEHYSHLVDLSQNTLYNRFMIARSYYYLNNLKQAEYEVDELLKESLNNDLVFESKLLKANIYFSQKEYKSSAKSYEELVEKFPELAKKNYVLLHLAMSYEERGMYKKAIASLQSLESYYHSPEFISAKIAHIQSKLKYMPGARGLRK